MDELTLPSTDSFQESALEEAILSYLKAAEAGHRPSSEEFLARYPELAPELEKFLDDQEKLDPVLKPLRVRKSESDKTGFATPEDFPSIPGYQILGKLGRGGMGVVYKALQIKANRLVALKMIRAGADADEAELARFRTEAEAIARLQHPNIVQIFEVGDTPTGPFFALEFCPGGSLAKKLDGTPLPPSEAARLSEQLARAVAAAHAKAVIHRDLKPGNILLASGGREPPDEEAPETGEGKGWGPSPADKLSGDSLPPLADLIPKITDFGLAKRLDDDVGQTRTGAVMGTPSYMAPEQALGESGKVGRACDVYALGAILYEMLTGRPPFKGATALETLDQVRTQEPVPPRLLQVKTPPDLETICLKCLQKEPRKRYVTAQDLADDLRRFQTGEPIQARPVGRVERMLKWVKRRPVVATLVLAIISLAIGGTWLGLLLQKVKEYSKEEKLRTQLANQKAQEEKLRKVLATGHKEGVTSLALSGDGKRLFSGSWDNTIKVWDLEAGKQTLTLRGAGNGGLVLSADGKRLISLSREAWPTTRCQVWDLEAGMETPIVYGSIRFISPDGKWLVSFGPFDPKGFDAGNLRAPDIKIWDLEAGKQILTLTGHAGSVCLALSGDGKRLFSGSMDGSILVWDLVAKEAFTLHGHTGGVRTLALSRDGKRLFSGSMDSTIKVWDFEAGKTFTLRGHNGEVSCLALSADGKRLFSHCRTKKFRDLGKPVFFGDYDSTIKVWDLEAGKETLTLRGDGWDVKSLALSGDGKRLFLRGSGIITVWDLEAGKEILNLRFKILVVSGDGKRLFSVGRWGRTTGWEIDQHIMVWDLEAGKLTLTLTGHNDVVTCLALSGDGKRLFSGSQDGTIKVWDVEASACGRGWGSGQESRAAVSQPGQGLHLPVAWSSDVRFSRLIMAQQPLGSGDQLFVLGIPDRLRFGALGQGGEVGNHLPQAQFGISLAQLGQEPQEFLARFGHGSLSPTVGK